MGEHKEDSWKKPAERVAQRGYSALTYDNRYWVSDARIDDKLRAQAPEDLRAAMKFIREQGAQRIVLIGASLGSMASAKVAAETNPAAVVLMASPIDRTNLPFLVTCDDIGAIASPKRFMVAEKDVNGFTEDVKKMYAIASAPKAVETWAGTAHGTDVFKDRRRGTVIDEILQFLEIQAKCAEN